jgi:hypothetical protein
MGLEIQHISICEQVRKTVNDRLTIFFADTNIDCHVFPLSRWIIQQVQQALYQEIVHGAALSCKRADSRLDRHNEKVSHQATITWTARRFASAFADNARTPASS